jgi:two-component system CheB/CheR fusion protein
MQNLMDATQIATVFLDRELHIQRYTPAAVRLFNLIPGDLGRPLTNMATQLDYEQLGDDARRVLERLVPIEREVGQSDGSWYLARLMPYRTMEDRIAGVVFTFIDITERKQAEQVRLAGVEALRQSEERMRLVLENAVEYAIFSMDLERRITSWNAGAQRLLGYAADEVMGRAADLIFTPEDRADEVPGKEARTAREEGRASDERLHLRKDGSRFPGTGTMMLMRNGAGEAVGLLKILRDRSERPPEPR